MEGVLDPPVRDHMSGNGFEDDVRPDLLAQHPELHVRGALGGTRTPNLLIPCSPAAKGCRLRTKGSSEWSSIAGNELGVKLPRANR